MFRQALKSQYCNFRVISYKRIYVSNWDRCCRLFVQQKLLGGDGRQPGSFSRCSSLSSINASSGIDVESFSDTPFSPQLLTSLDVEGRQRNSEDKLLQARLQLKAVKDELQDATDLATEKEEELYRLHAANRAEIEADRKRLEADRRLLERLQEAYTAERDEKWNELERQKQQLEDERIKFVNSQQDQSTHRSELEASPSYQALLARLADFENWKVDEEKMYQARLQALDSEKELLRQKEETYKMADEKRMESVGAQTDLVDFLENREAQLTLYVQQRELAFIPQFETEIPVYDPETELPELEQFRKRRLSTPVKPSTSPVASSPVTAKFSSGGTQTLEVSNDDFEGYSIPPLQMSEKNVLACHPMQRERLLAKTTLSKSADSIDTAGLPQIRRLTNRSPSPRLIRSSTSLASVPESIDEEIDDISKSSRFTVSAHDIRMTSPPSDTVAALKKNHRRSLEERQLHRGPRVSVSRSDVAATADRGYSSGSNHGSAVPGSTNSDRSLESLSSSPVHEPILLRTTLNPARVKPNNNRPVLSASKSLDEPKLDTKTNKSSKEVKSKNVVEKTPKEKNPLQKWFSRLQKSSSLLQKSDEPNETKSSDKKRPSKDKETPGVSSVRTKKSTNMVGISEVSPSIARRSLVSTIGKTTQPVSEKPSKRNPVKTPDAGRRVETPKKKKVPTATLR